MIPPANRMAYRNLFGGSEASRFFGSSTLSGLTRLCAVLARCCNGRIYKVIQRLAA